MVSSMLLRVESPRTPLLSSQGRPAQGGRIVNNLDWPGPPPFELMLPTAVPPAVLLEDDEEVEGMAEPALVELPSAPLVRQPPQSLSGSANPSGPDPSDASVAPLGQQPLTVDLLSSSDESDGNAAFFYYFEGRSLRVS